MDSPWYQIGVTTSGMAQFDVKATDLSLLLLSYPAERQ